MRGDYLDSGWNRLPEHEVVPKGLSHRRCSDVIIFTMDSTGVLLPVLKTASVPTQLPSDDPCQG